MFGDKKLAQIYTQNKQAWPTGNTDTNVKQFRTTALPNCRSGSINKEGEFLLSIYKDRYVPLNWVGRRLPNVLKSGLIILEDSLNMGHRENAMGRNT